MGHHEIIKTLQNRSKWMTMDFIRLDFRFHTPIHPSKFFYFHLFLKIKFPNFYFVSFLINLTFDWKTSNYTNDCVVHTFHPKVDFFPVSFESENHPLNNRKMRKSRATLPNATNSWTYVQNRSIFDQVQGNLAICMPKCQVNASSLTLYKNEKWLRKINWNYGPIKQLISSYRFIFNIKCFVLFYFVGWFEAFQ